MGKLRNKLLGKPAVTVTRNTRDTVTVTDRKTGKSGNEYVYSVTLMHERGTERTCVQTSRDPGNPYLGYDNAWLSEEGCIALAQELLRINAKETA